MSRSHRWSVPGVVSLALALASPAAAGPRLDHVVVVMMENHSYDEVRFTPYVAGLIAGGTSFANAHGVTHPSEPNYHAIWSGATQPEPADGCPALGSPYTNENLGHACEAAGLRWRAYSEGLPSVGSTVCSTAGGVYTRKHDPWTDWSNLNHANERPFADLALDVAHDSLPALAFVIPSNCNNTHDCPVTTGDTWLSQNLPGLLSAIGPHGLLVLTWDEDDFTVDNHILTVYAGPLVKAGYVSSRRINHYTVLRTICDGLGLTPFAGAALDSTMDDVWDPAKVGVAPGLVKAAVLRAVGPNPSRGEVRASLSLASPCEVVASIHDVAGRRVRTIAAGERSGEVVLRWDGLADDGTPAPAGLYRLAVRAGAQRFERSLVRLH